MDAETNLEPLWERVLAGGCSGLFSSLGSQHTLLSGPADRSSAMLVSKWFVHCPIVARTHSQLPDSAGAWYGKSKLLTGTSLM